MVSKIEETPSKTEFWLPSDVFRLFGRPVYHFGRPKIIFQVFFFQLFQQKCVGVTIIHFTLHYFEMA